MLNLAIDQKTLLLQTETHRVVGEGVPGFRIKLHIECAVKDVLGETAWVGLDCVQFNRAGECDDDAGLTAQMWLMTLEDLVRTRHRLTTAEQHLDAAKATIAEMKEQREDEALEALEEYPEN